MATTTAGSNLPTRQQLDEIDTLLRRMLSLPALGSDPEPAPPAASTYGPTIREIPPATPPSPGDPVVHSWRVEWPHAAPPAPVPEATPTVAAWGSPATTPYARAVPVNPVPAPGVTFVEQPPPSRLAPPVPGYLWPALVVNWVFDALSYLLGPLGAWLRGSGRPVLGWTGVVMILAAAGWAFGEWAGYDWPRVDVARWVKPDRG
ncbi:MAG TPA: hypothetical protein VM597_23990 [Gemmataceae bacterium]|jgi:hypothetical protein|nr:hypothetical protein [Gemmataceae bacterium]